MSEPLRVTIEQGWQDRARDWLIQTLGFAAAVVFGTWTILAWQEAKQANIQSTQANTLAFAAFCAQAPTQNETKLSQLCGSANAALQASVTAIAIAMFGPPTSTVTSTTSPTSSAPTTSTPGTGTSSFSPTASAVLPPTTGAGSSGLSTAQIVGVVVGSVSALSAILGAVSFCRSRPRY